MQVKVHALAFLRFCNVLDDVEDKLSPVKLNVWAANMGAVSTAVATAFAWAGGHVSGIESVWAGTMTWLTHAHTVHHFDKRERNVQKARIIAATTETNHEPH